MKNRFIFLLFLLAPSFLFSMSKEQALCEAVDRDDEENVRKLLDEGADPLIPNKRGSIPLMAALGHGRSIQMEDRLMCIHLEKQILIKDASGLTVLHHAARRLNARVIPLFMAAGAQINDDKNVFKSTPLMSAVVAFAYSPNYIEWQTNTVKELLRCGADPRIQDTQNDTPLNVAEKCGKKHLIPLLKEKLASYNDSSTKQ